MRTNEFYNKNGTLTRYALSCGYIEKKKNVELYRDCVYHVRKKEDNGLAYHSDPLAIWESFDTLTEARKRFNELAR